LKLLWIVTQHMFVALYGRFGTACGSRLQGSSNPRVMPRISGSVVI